MCDWSIENDVDSSSGRCHFRPIQGNLIRVATIALISAVVSAPLSLGVQYLISNILSKETAQGEDCIESAQISPSTTKVSKRLRKTAILISGRKERGGDSVISDLHCLLNEVQVYRQHISDKERQIFDG
jgi:hypothetical protein